MRPIKNNLRMMLNKPNIRVFMYVLLPNKIYSWSTTGMESKPHISSADSVNLQPLNEASTSTLDRVGPSICISSNFNFFLFFIF